MLYASLLCEERRFLRWLFRYIFQLGRLEYRIKCFKLFAACTLSMKERAIEDVAIFVLRLCLL